MTHDRSTAPDHVRWLLELTEIPTAAGHEQRVVAWIERWLADRTGLSLATDDAGNLIIGFAEPDDSQAPLFITAHLDHPAFVIERIVGPATVEATFRGGVMDPYFKDARVELFTAADQRLTGTVQSKEAGEPFPRCVIDLEGDASTDDLAPGDIARWDLGESRVEDGLLSAPACDDLAAVAAACATMDRLRSESFGRHTRLLFTRAEEVGFIGAIAACRLGTITKGARVLALENSRSFPSDSPIGGGPIVRVGDRLSTFSPTLTAAVSRAAARLAGEEVRSPGTPSASGDPSRQKAPEYKWQRKLMAGGACEATAFQAYGHDATCICLPLGNYHNMGDLQRVQDGVADAIAGASPAPEQIAIKDYEGMIDLLVACAESLDAAQPVMSKLDKLYSDRSFVLD